MRAGARTAGTRNAGRISRELLDREPVNLDMHALADADAGDAVATRARARHLVHFAIADQEMDGPLQSANRQRVARLHAFRIGHLLGRLPVDDWDPLVAIARRDLVLAVLANQEGRVA